jgi:hypothetical protein
MLPPTTGLRWQTTGTTRREIRQNLAAPGGEHGIVDGDDFEGVGVVTARLEPI